MTTSRVSTYFRALAASCVLYKRTEHSRGFVIWRLKSAFSSISHVLHLIVFFSLTNMSVVVTLLTLLWVAPPKRLGCAVSIGITETNFGNAHTLGMSLITS